jgi:hypothetical protein
MEMKSKKEIKTSKILEKNEDSKISNNIDENNDENYLVCKHNDKDCWHRYSSAMGDCV